MSPQGESPWLPIADPGLAERARKEAGRIAALYSRPLPAWAPEGASADERAALDASLASGAAGQALLHAMLARQQPGGGERDRARDCLDRAIRAMARVPMDVSLLGGFVGIAWALEHLALACEGGPGTRGGEDPLDSIDEILVHALDSGGSPREYDLVSGLTGIGVYALERMPRPKAAECLGLVVQGLAERAERIGPGRAWRTPPRPPAPGMAPLGPFDLGVAHGVPGVIALLGQACAWDVAADSARAQLGEAVGWLLDQRLPADATGCFPASCGHVSEREPARLAWCYGDAGLSVALLNAGRAVGEGAWADEALAIARRAAARPEGDSGVRDAGLCHGASGLALIFHTLHHATSDPAFAEAAERWTRRTLDLRHPDGFAGYPAMESVEGGAERWVDDPGLLGGAAGVALALLAVSTTIEPEWDRMLVLSARSSGAPGGRAA